MKQLIKYCYLNCTEDIIPLSQARPHEIRGMAASLCLTGNIKLEDIMSGCTWKKHTTFTSFYLKDMSMIKEELHSLGPVVAARQVVQV